MNSYLQKEAVIYFSVPSGLTGHSKCQAVILSALPPVLSEPLHVCVCGVHAVKPAKGYVCEPV